MDDNVANGIPQSLPPVMVGGPVPEMARQGRHKQRYAATGERLIAGCIPVRLTSDQPGLHNVEILLISSRAGKGYCFPKGGWEDDETLEDAAKRETVEEAGVRGELEEPQIGMFHFSSGKPGSHQKSVHQGKCIAHMFVLHVAEMLDVWPESEERQRIWVPLVDAVWRCRHDWMREALLTWVKRKGWSMPTAQGLESTGHSVYSGPQQPQDQNQQQQPVMRAVQLASCASSDTTTLDRQMDVQFSATNIAGLGVQAHPHIASIAACLSGHSSHGMLPPQSSNIPPHLSITFASGNSISTCGESDMDCGEPARSTLLQQS